MHHRHLMLEVIQRTLNSMTPEKQELYSSAQAYLDKWLKPEEEQHPTIFYQMDLSEERSMEPDLLEDMEPTFSQKLFDLIKKQGISETDCYKILTADCSQRYAVMTNISQRRILFLH